MGYTALYREFRPKTFSEMVGQEHITKTLKNQITAGRVGHAYLFNGGRGTGKTSAAKILARAINCLNPKDGEPCNECEICKGILSGSITDVVEMDAASNNSVEDIRTIREEVNFLPTIAKYRVYIIDEVHMLSTGAFNALLKTLEEPPAHVKFILATTEPQKLPATILSRCQRFDFKKISEQNIVKRLKLVCEQSEINITEEAMNTIAILAGGAMRDALSILERCTQEQSQITSEMVKELVGIPQTEAVAGLTNEMVLGDTKLALESVNKIIESGKDIENFLWELTKYIKDILICKSNGSLSIYSEEEKKKIKEIADKTTENWLTTAIYELSNLAMQIKWSSQKIVMFEVSIIKLSNNQLTSKQNSSLDLDKIEKLEEKIEQLENEIKNIDKTVLAGRKNKLSQNAVSESSIKPNIKNVELKNENIQPILVGEKLKNWKEIVNNIKQTGKMLVYTNLINSEATKINDMTVGITFPNGLTRFGKSILEQTENMNEIVKQVSIALGAATKVKIVETEEDAKKLNASNKNNNTNGLEKLGIPINIIEE